MATNVIMIPRQESPWAALLPQVVAATITNNMQMKKAMALAEIEARREELKLKEQREYTERIKIETEKRAEGRDVAKEQRSEYKDLRSKGFEKRQAGTITEQDVAPLSERNQPEGIGIVRRGPRGETYTRSYTPFEKRALRDIAPKALNELQLIAQSVGVDITKGKVTPDEARKIISARTGILADRAKKSFLQLLLSGGLDLTAPEESVEPQVDDREEQLRNRLNSLTDMLGK